VKKNIPGTFFFRLLNAHKKTCPQKKITRPQKDMTTPNNNVRSIPSCGLSLLQAPLDTFDYALFLTDRKIKIKIQCHRCVLLAHSERLRDLICNENFFDLDVCVQPGYLTAAVEVIQYMYLKDPTLITCVDKVLDMCGMFHMQLDHFLIAHKKLQPLNQYPVVKMIVQVAAGGPGTSCLLAQKFWESISVEEGAVAAMPSPKSNPKTLTPKKKTSAPQKPQEQEEEEAKRPILNIQSVPDGVVKQVSSPSPPIPLPTKKKPKAKRKRKPSVGGKQQPKRAKKRTRSNKVY